jgi:hypothetical protein
VVIKMKVKTSELIDFGLDWAVAKCEGLEVFIKYAPVQVMYTPQGKRSWYIYSPSSNWKQGGPIIEREKIAIGYTLELPASVKGNEWCALNHDRYVKFDAGGDVEEWPLPNSIGPTPLIAAMRCFVASKLGDDVEIPKELTK